MTAADASPAASAFETHRAELEALAYRLTGSRAEAEDLVQEAFLRLHREPEPPDNPRAWLYRVTTHLGVDHLRSARHRREVYPGPWLPEPMASPTSSFADAAVELAEEATLALLLALERLTPAERAVFVLREAFDVEYCEIADALERSEAACRKLASRARAHVREARPRRVQSPTPDEAQRVLQAFVGAVATGDVAMLTQVLADDAVLVSDGGGKALAARRPIEGAARITRFLLGTLEKYPLKPGTRILPGRINGLPGLIIFEGDACVQTLAFDLREGRVAAIFTVRNPDKLARIRDVLGAG